MSDDFEMEVVESPSLEDGSSDEGTGQPSPSGDSSSSFLVGALPDEWDAHRLDDICQVNPESFSQDSHEADEFEYISLSDATDGVVTNTESVPVEEAPSRATRKVREGDVLVGTVRPKQSSHGFATEEHDGKVCSSGFGVLRTDGHVNSQYLRQEVLSHRFFRQMMAYVAGSGYPAVKLSDLEKHRIALPSLPEQRKIASVLYTVDQAIQKTEAIIEQIRVVEKGLFQKLFSGEHLDRRKREASTLGEIPVHWEVRRMGEVCDITMGSSPKSKYYNERGEGLPFFQANNEFGLRNPTHDRWCSSPVKTASSGDVLMTIRGTYVGQVNVSDRKCCIGRGLAAISSGGHYHPEFLYHHLRSREHYVKSIAIGSTFDSVSSGDLQKLDVVVPPVEEQRVIADTLQSIQNEMMESHRYVEKLRRVKKGLMQDLLTGEVRTATKAIEVLDEVAEHG